MRLSAIVAFIGAAAVFAPAATAAPPPSQALQGTGEPLRFWKFGEYRAGGPAEIELASGSQYGGRLAVSHDFGPSIFDFDFPPDGIATGRIRSSATGKTFDVFAQAPTGNPNEDTSPVGNIARLEQYTSYRKMAADSTLTFTISSAIIETIDANGGQLLPSECDEDDLADCADPIEGQLYFEAQAYAKDGYIFHTIGGAKLSGWQEHWNFDAWTYRPSTSPFWSKANFATNNDVSDTHTLTDARLELIEPKRFAIDLSSIAVGQEFALRILTTATTLDRRGRESYVDAYVKDPQKLSGTAIETTGLKVTNHPLLAPPLLEPPAAAPACAGDPDPAAGTLQFSVPTYRVGEWAGAGPAVVVTRTGGSTGAVSATFTSSDGTANAGADYTPEVSTVTFADGDTSSRVIPVSIVADDTPEDDKTVNLSLSEPGGCAALGTQTNAVLTIVDDDRPIETPTSFTVGGTVNGLEGSGLVLGNLGEDLPTGNGAFTFSQAMPTGIPYDVRVVTQPSDPAQICTVTNGAGTVADVNITDVAVDCVTPAPVSGLDDGFGDGGKVTTAGLRGTQAVAVQSDGKIVAAGEFALARYDTDGSLDETFGGGDGKVTTGLDTGFFGDAGDVAVQPDGKIVVVGITGFGSGENFGVERYDAQGNVDTSFGGGDGKVVTDFNGGVDRAYGVAIQADDKIVVAGHAADATQTGSDYAVARYDAAGELDTTFGGGDGLVTTNIAGEADFGHAVTLQPDGFIVVAGRVSDDGGSGENFGLVRYDTTGVLDPSFGVAGVAIADFGSESIANGLALQSDGKIVVTGSALGDFAVARFRTDGQLDPTFGDAGLVTTDFGVLVGPFPAAESGSDVAVQPDGKIVVAGTNNFDRGSDMAVVRYLDDGLLDTNFDTDGKLTVDFNGGFDSGRDVAIQADGKIVAAGTAANGTGIEFALVRVNP
jgi:uncharacterized delta-60 repeat protein